MRELEYPFEAAYILKKKRSLKKKLLSDGTARVKKKIAVLGGSTTSDIVSVLELFLLDSGIEAEFYQSEYAQYWQDAVFGNPVLDSFEPDLIFIHTTYRNLDAALNVRMTRQEADAVLEERYSRLEQMWSALDRKFRCPIIQNNFELPFFRLMGSREAYDYRGTVNLITRLNMKLYDYAAEHESFYINDINWLSAAYGLDKWFDLKYWYLYKYAMSLEAVPEYAFQTANIIKSVFGRNKKCIAVDLDNTMWGGIVGDDGAENLEIGQETGTAQAYYEFQQYIKSYKDLGIVLTVCSKNEEENALAGLSHPEGAVSPEDFTLIKANWLPKDRNISDIAQELNILPEAIVFCDDNPAEREIVRSQLAGAAVPEIGEVTDYIRILDRSGFFEVTSLSEDDLKRNEMYKANIARANSLARFESYEDYLLSLEMTAEIQPFKPVYIQRITQLTNKSNQFNFTTKRYTQTEIEDISKNEKYVTLYGKLADKFGDNGVVSVIIGEKNGDTLTIELWLMSCRVLKRDMELAMLDALAAAAAEQGISRLVGVYIPTAKNKMVKDFYPDVLGFSPLCANSQGVTSWELDISGYENKNKVIKVN
ncbi:HAD-IIIC family phosphatase [Ruminococcus sp. Marseille-P6503]|uniref:HAD-IIIC family phosphatase n=1 Tax=Ruminococcus sp. Marseille-P6503 TaxID=2364796 RepID=UPI000F528B26|nr:HAD-IIIC family phosphatase [Ruminococcus sp. Marseille-P6503]